MTVYSCFNVRETDLVSWTFHNFNYKYILQKKYDVLRINKIKLVIVPILLYKTSGGTVIAK